MITQTVSFEYKGIAEGKYTEGVVEALDTVSYTHLRAHET